MVKKSVFIVILVLSVFLVISSIQAASNDTEEKSFTCLKNQLGNNCGNSQSTQTTAFNLLSMSYDSKIQSNCKNSLYNLKKTNCWSETSSGSCSIKATAQAVIALKTIGENVNDAVNWLLARKKPASGFTWFLEIDSLNQTTCTINGRDFVIQDNKQITGNDPSGLIKTYNNYWFQILDLSKNFTISCDKDFVTTLLYQRPDSNSFFVSSEPHTASAGDSTNEKAESYCFSTSNTCEYEATLWAAIALQKAGEDIRSFIPYLSAMSSENQIYFPSAFLYMLNHADDSYYLEMKDLQKQGKYWDVSGKKLYDTSVGLLALQSSDEGSAVKDYLLSIRQDSGCWQSDTSFILYSGWSKTPTITGSETSPCESFSGYSCVSSSECAGIKYTIDMYCSGTNICCSNRTEELSCSDKQGIICNSDEECSGDIVRAGDTHECCKGSCTEPIVNECENQGYSCSSSCSSEQEEKLSLSDTCPNLEKCCSAKQVASGFSWWILIIILAILILLLIIAIIFRDKVKIWFFKMKSGFKTKKSPPPSSRPIIPQPFRPMQRPRQFLPRQPYRPTGPRPQKNKDNEFENVMKKLRDMSK